jgi:hypothetical protein
MSCGIAGGCCGWRTCWPAAAAAAAAATAAEAEAERRLLVFSEPENEDLSLRQNGGSHNNLMKLESPSDFEVIVNMFHQVPPPTSLSVILQSIEILTQVHKLHTYK